MKTSASIVKVILLAGLFISFGLLNANTAPGTKTVNATEKTIQSYFKVPGILMPLHNLKKSESQKIEVLFTTNAKGEVNFVLAKTEQADLRSEVERQFLKLHLAQLKPDVVHSVVLNFRTL